MVALAMSAKTAFIIYVIMIYIYIIWNYYGEASINLCLHL